MSSAGLRFRVPSDTFSGNFTSNLTDSAANSASANPPLTIVEFFRPSSIAWIGASCNETGAYKKLYASLLLLES